MDTTAIIAILAVIATIATAIAAAAGAALSVLRKQQGAPGAETLAPEGAHVHTYLITSKEETAGRALNVYRCAQCGQIERRQAN